MRYRAFIETGSLRDPLAQEAVIYLVLDQTPGGKPMVLHRDGSWVEPEEGGTYDPDAGFRLPIEALEAVYEAVDRARNARMDSPTEAKVLREALDVERARVDKVLGIVSGPPRIVDMGQR